MNDATHFRWVLLAIFMESTFSPEQRSKFLRHCILLVGAWDPYITMAYHSQLLSSTIPIPYVLKKLGFCHCSSVCCLAQVNHPEGKFWNMIIAWIWAVAKIQVLQNGIVFLSFGLKIPFGFPCLAHVCLSNSFGFVCFSTAYVTLVVALLFGSLVLLPAFLQGFIQSASVPPLHYVTLRGGRACMFLRVDGRCFWFCGLRVIAFSSRAKHMLQIPEVLQAVL